MPGSHSFDPHVSDSARLADPTVRRVAVAVPAGTVTVYALHLMHRGSANTDAKERDRPFYFFTLMPADGAAPPGLAYTIQPADIGEWAIDGRELSEVQP